MGQAMHVQRGMAVSDHTTQSLEESIWVMASAWHRSLHLRSLVWGNPFPLAA